MPDITAGYDGRSAWVHGAPVVLGTIGSRHGRRSSQSTSSSLNVSTSCTTRSAPSRNTCQATRAHRSAVHRAESTCIRGDF